MQEQMQFDRACAPTHRDSGKNRQISRDGKMQRLPKRIVAAKHEWHGECRAQRDDDQQACAAHAWRSGSSVAAICAVRERKFGDAARGPAATSSRLAVGCPGDRLTTLQSFSIRHVLRPEENVPQRGGHSEVRVRVVVVDMMNGGPTLAQRMAKTHRVDGGMTQAVGGVARSQGTRQQKGKRRGCNQAEKAYQHEQRQWRHKEWQRVVSLRLLMVLAMALFHD